MITANGRPTYVALFFAFFSFMLTQCNDPNDPQTWIKRLRDPEHAANAVSQLKRIGDPVAVQPLCDLFKDYESRNILEVIVSFKDKRAIPTLINTLNFDEDKYTNATLAAKTLAEMQVKEAIEPMIKALDRPLSVRSRANLVKQAVIEALTEMGDKSAVPALIRTLERRPEEQDFFLNKKAAEALGQFKDPSAVPALIRALFMSSTLQGSSFPEARVALVWIGKPAVAPLLSAMARKDEALETMAKELEFSEGVIEQKIAIVLGDLKAVEAVPALLDSLAKANLNETKALGVVEALGNIRDPRAETALINLLLNTKATHKLRTGACEALTIMRSQKAASALLEMAEKGYIEGGYTNLREAAVMAYSRVVGQGAAAGAEKIKAMIEEDKIKEYAETQGVFKEALGRVMVAVECAEDAVCYGQKLLDTKLTLAQREKAGIMIGAVPDGRKAMDHLIKALPEREPVLRQYYLGSAVMIGTPADTQLIKTIEELAAKDSKRRAKFLGADLASADKIALANILNK